MFTSPRGRLFRRNFAITAYVGSNGGGKTCGMVWDTLPSLEAGRPVLSTVRLLDYDNPRPCTGGDCSIPAPRVLNGEIVDHTAWHAQHRQQHPLYIPFTDWRQLHEAEHCDVLMDEVTGVASSRESHAMPGPVANRLNQLRRADAVLRWTAPAWGRADTIIRSCTQTVVSCRGLLAKTYKAAPGEPERMWKERRLFSWRAYDAYAFEDFTAGARERLKPMGSDLHWGPSSPAFLAYDTYDAVLSIGTANEAGRCMTCGGRRSAPACECPDYQRPARGARRSTAGPRLRGAATGDAAGDHGHSGHDHGGDDGFPHLEHGGE